jgi:threonine dehydratase
MKFLYPDWNISLLHYHNHGVDYVCIVLGMRVHPDEMSECQVFLDTLGYPYCNESENPAYKLFLGSSD